MNVNATSSTSYCYDGAVFNTQMQSWVKVTAHGQSGQGASWFSVQTKNGIQLQYGNTPDNKVLAVGSVFNSGSYETTLSLLVRYWRAEWGNRSFDIYVDDEKLVTENNTGRWNQSRFFDINYQIPASMLKGKNNIRIKFKALKARQLRRFINIRLIRAP